MINQSILITGESGAGKTENTKKVISYFATICSSGKRKEGEASLEDKIVQTNPVLEAWGNAKTVRNDNSSRFGKFIRIHFNSAGKLSGADMVVYLLEKSRLTYQQPLERCYHAFYNIMSDQVKDLKEKCHLSNDILDYWFVSQGKLTVPSIDDREDMQFANEAFDVLGFSEEMKYNVFKNTAAMMHMGNMTKDFVPVGKDEQAEVKDETNSGYVADLLGIDCEWMITYFCKPKLKVGTEWVQKGSSCTLAAQSVSGIARAIYERTFRITVDKCNETLCDPTMKKVTYIGILDIAGFEIFDYNGFEQISINYVNEKLQQFFNHHMFVVEQEEYVREGIDWVMVDFGMDLAAAIIMFEKPMGIWAILEEESLFPKATDKSFEEKLKASLGKLPVFQKAKSATDKNAHFACVHYAGTVAYNVTGWLDKNKDPVNETVVEILKQGNNNLMKHLWREHPGQPTEVKKDEGKKKKKGGGGKTVSSVYLVSLTELMHTLHTCEPHFVRCLVPNTHKKPGEVEPPLIMHQLTCNGVLEGIRICMRGFPNRMLYPDFKLRYSCLGQDAIKSSEDNKTAVYALMDGIPFDRERYRLGHTLVFFRAGSLGGLEEERDKLVIKWVRFIQGEALKRIRGQVYQKKFDQRELIKVGQRNFRKFLSMRDWGWFIIIQKTRGLIGLPNPQEELEQLEAKAGATWGKYDEQLKTKDRLLEENVSIKEETKALMAQLEKEQGNLSVYHDKQAKANAGIAANEAELKNTQDALAAKERARQDATADKKVLEQEVVAVKKDIDDVNMAITKVEQEKTNRDHTIRSLNDEIASQDEIINKLNKEKKHIGDNAAKSSEDLTVAEEKVNHLNQIKKKLESTLDELESSLEKEKRARTTVEKDRRKIEGDLKVTQESVADQERARKEFEATIQRKEKDASGLMAKLDDEQSLVSKVQKSIKESQARVEEMEEELEAERQSRARLEWRKWKKSL